MAKFLSIALCSLMFCCPPLVSQVVETIPNKLVVDSARLIKPELVTRAPIMTKHEATNNNQIDKVDMVGPLSIAITVLTLLITFSIPVLINFYRVFTSQVKALSNSNNNNNYINSITTQFIYNQTQLLCEDLDDLPSEFEASDVSSYAKRLAYIQVDANIFRDNLENLQSMDSEQIFNACKYFNNICIDESAVWLREFKSYLRFLWDNDFFDRDEKKRIKTLEKETLSNVVYDLPNMGSKVQNKIQDAIKSGALAIIAFMIMTVVVLFLLGRLHLYISF